MIIHTFRTEAEVIHHANDSEFGLYASVYTQDVSHALRVAKRLEAGSVAINSTSMVTQAAVDVTFGGTALS